MADPPLSPADAALHAAAGDAAATAAALAGGACAAAADPATGRTALHAAAEAGNCDVISLLLAAGAPWNAVDRAGRCAGEAANDAGHAAAAAALLDAGVRAELVLGALQTAAGGSGSEPAEAVPYLDQAATFDAPPGARATALVDAAGRGVMMDWEAPLMEAHAHLACRGGGAVLNLVGRRGGRRGGPFHTLPRRPPTHPPHTPQGHGLGIVDRAIASRNPPRHVICEAHPAVLARLDAEGWPARPGVTIVRGRWQDALADGRLAAGGPYGGIFFDTFDDGDAALDLLFAAAPALLTLGGTLSFFNGLCADNPFFHAVACGVVERKLAAAGADCAFVPLPLPAAATADATWEGVTNRYWQLTSYALPVITWPEGRGGGEGEH
jgi:protein arginine N-methyltransferase 2